MKRAPRIAFVGDLTMDRYIKQNQVLLGGSSLTGSIWARRLGARASVVAAVGSDDAGKMYFSTSRKHTINASHVRKMRGKTSSIDIITRDDGERTYGAWQPGVLKRYTFSLADRCFLKKQDAVVLTVYDKTAHLLHQFSRFFAGAEHKPLRVVDFGDLSQFEKSADIAVQYLDAIDIAVFGLDKDEDEQLINALRTIAHTRKKTFVVTLNRFGAIAYAGEQFSAVGALESPIVDTTGAGDAFLAAFVVSYLKTNDVQKSLAAGTTCAARVIQKVGAY